MNNNELQPLDLGTKKRLALLGISNVGDKFDEMVDFCNGFINNFKRAVQVMEEHESGSDSGFGSNLLGKQKGNFRSN